MAKKKATLRMLLCFRFYENFIFPRRWRICIHFSQRINKWEKIWSAAPSVCRNEQDGRARKSAEERGGRFEERIRGDRRVPLRSSSWRYSFVGPLRYHIIHT